MPLQVIIPPLGESVVSGILAKWHVADGAAVKKDQPLYELETDKITSEGLAEADGVITLAVAEGAEVKIGQVVATIEVGAASTQAAPAAAPASAQSAIRDPQSAIPPSPAVRRLAEETKIDPATVAGTGKAGRVTKGDMLAAAEARGERQELPGRPPPRLRPPYPQSTARSTRRKMTPLRAKYRRAPRPGQEPDRDAHHLQRGWTCPPCATSGPLPGRLLKRHGIKLGFHVVL
jgi:2-oxoglutarate dehydrogenase E2 component (dihydrolipoamide succinyltransferase)